MTNQTRDEKDDDEVMNEVNQFGFDIKQTMAQLNKYLIYLNQYKLTSIINIHTSNTQKYSTQKKELNQIELPSNDLINPPNQIKKYKHPNSQKVQCQFCSRSFFSLTSYKEHLRNKHQKVTKFHCPICGYSGGRSRRIAIHLLEKHRTKTNSYLCPFTQNEFVSLDELTKHLCMITQYLSIGSKIEKAGNEQTVQQQQNDEIAVKLNESEQEQD